MNWLLRVSRIKTKREHQASGIENDLDRQPVAPAIFFAKEVLDNQPRLAITPLIQRTRRRVKLTITNTHMYSRVALDVLHPIRVLKVLREKVELTLRFHEPYLDFTRPSADAPDSSQVQVLDAR